MNPNSWISLVIGMLLFGSGTVGRTGCLTFASLLATLCSEAPVAEGAPVGAMPPVPSVVPHVAGIPCCLPASVSRGSREGTHHLPFLQMTDGAAWASWWPPSHWGTDFHSHRTPCRQAFVAHSSFTDMREALPCSLSFL